ncbi:proline iminopeptidase [Microbacterium testaceum]|uniref:alpha/beta fold hydrolase n=1 Tax=Microbacterium TaxID=33882 RepID=UPI00278A33E9|nr:MULTISPECIES: alpha/beta fold hydrolase [Microbacterium]MDQ1113419.1 proline iminopeptidase [Microbacterium testaceum]MDR6099480.1 proline iminopeptidase [Microbacterium sp. SORGH_AS_0454]
MQHPPLEPFDSGFVERPDGARLYWETSGNPRGRPALYLHGGPGGNLGKGGYRRRFDPTLHLIVGIDQRGCGRSEPWAMDDLSSLQHQTMDDLLADIEAVRVHLGIDRWLLHGVSWGSTLALAYALEHPDRVTEIVNLAVTTGGRWEIDWITDGIAPVFPEAYERLRSLLRADERTIEGYARLLTQGDPHMRQVAADQWDEWEATHMSLGPLSTPGPLHDDERHRRNFATLVSHYWARDCFLTGDAAILARAEQLAGIPGVLVHGRRDISGPALTAWRLHRAWPGSRLEIVEEDGHGGPRSAELSQEAMDAFARASR